MNGPAEAGACGAEGKVHPGEEQGVSGCPERSETFAVPKMRGHFCRANIWNRTVFLKHCDEGFPHASVLSPVASWNAWVIM